MADTPAVIPPPPPAVPAPAVDAPDPFMARILEDMGKAISDGEVIDAPAKAPEEPKNVIDGDFVSMGEHARFKKEREEAEKAKTGEKPAEAPKEGDKKAEDSAAKEEPKPAADPAAPAAPATAPDGKPAPKKIVVEKTKPIEEIVEVVVRRIAQQNKPTEPEKPAPKKEAVADPDADYIASLDDAQREAVELAQFAAKTMPDKYGAMAKKTLDYLKKVDQYIDGKRKEDADWDPDADEGFASFIEENQPSYHSGDRRKLERAQITEAVREDVVREFKPKIEATEKAERAREIKPEIDKAVDSYRGAVAQRFAPDDKSAFSAVLKVATEKGLTDEAWTEAKSVDPLAAATAQSYMAQASAMGREYLELVSGVTTQAAYDPALSPSAAANQKAITQHRLFSFIDSQEKIFAEQGGDMRTVAGRTFVPRRELAAMSQADQAKHWTLGHEDVLDMLAVAAAAQANQALAAEVKRREDEGYVRNGKHSGTKKEPAPTPAPTKKEESPKTSLTPSPGAANLPPPVSGPTAFTSEELQRMWGGGPAVYKG